MSPALTNHNRHVFDAELRAAGRSNIAIPFLNQPRALPSSRNMHGGLLAAGGAPHRRVGFVYDIAWTNTYLVGIDFTATATAAATR